MRISDWSSDVCSSDLLRLGNGNLEMLRRLRARRRFPVAERSVEFLLHFGERRVADDEDSRIVGTNPRRMEGRELVARRRGDRVGIAEARGRNARGMLGAVDRKSVV